jgi:1,4-alpha-glucan branching enzyme
MAEINVPEQAGKEALPSGLFHAGIHHRAYETLGCHRIPCEDAVRTVFRVWAPNAKAVSLVSDFTDWETGEPLSKTGDEGVWEIAVESGAPLDGRYYKYAVTGADGITRLKADPYAFQSETLGKTASVVRDISGHVWKDARWLAKRSATVCPKQRGFKPKVTHFYSAPLNIYEVHLGSWRTEDGLTTENGDHYLNYREIADRLAPYVSEMGFTHVELLPVMEHPYDGSLGYQVCGYFAPTSRFGDPEDFRYLIETLHEHGIGVILDWVPSRFPKDEHGLCAFDGGPLYEVPETGGTGRDDCRFDLGKPEVRSFLISCALFWLKEYHADGLRIDSVASMLYPDRDPAFGDRSGADAEDCSPEAVSFLRELNAAVAEEIPDALMIAGEASPRSMVTVPAADGGLGFSFKWNTGWASEMYSYVSTDPVARKYVHGKLTDPVLASFGDNSILPVSHDAVTGGRKSLVDKCFGEYDDKFANMRTMLLCMMTLPGKKLLFMGCEFAQFREWDYKSQLEWFMTDYPRHVEMQRFVKAVNGFYLSCPALWEIDDGWDGFEWIRADERDLNILSFRRRDKKGREIIAALNFAPVRRDGYALAVPKMGRYEEVFSTDRYEFGGRNVLNEAPVRARTEVGDDGVKRSVLDVTLPPLGGVIFRKQQNNSTDGGQYV